MNPFLAFFILRLWNLSLLLLTIIPTFLQFYLLKSDYFSSNLKKRALPWLLTPFLGKNNFIFPRTGVKSQGKARFLRLELNIGLYKGSVVASCPPLLALLAPLEVQKKFGRFLASS